MVLQKTFGKPMQTFAVTFKNIKEKNNNYYIWKKMLNNALGNICQTFTAILVICGTI